MNSIRSNLVGSISQAAEANLGDLHAQDAPATTPVTTTPGNAEPLLAAQHSLAALVPEGGLHPVSPKPDQADIVIDLPRPPTSDQKTVVDVVIEAMNRTLKGPIHGGLVGYYG
jgi:hypothetical protein